MSFGSLPHPKINHGDYITGVPIHARDCLCLTEYDGTSRVSAQCTLLKSIIQAYHKMQTSVQTIPHIEGTRRGVILL